jgi:Ni,Fe-hydrogenase III small subunit
MAMRRARVVLDWFKTSCGRARTTNSRCACSSISTVNRLEEQAPGCAPRPAAPSLRFAAGLPTRGAGRSSPWPPSAPG